MKKRGRKDPKAPKGASGPFIFYSSAKVAELKAKEGLKHIDATKRAGALWKQMSDAEKQPFYDMAEKDKARAAEAFAKYEAEREDDGGEESKETERKDRRKKVKKDPNAPKKNSNAFMFFSKTRVPEIKTSDGLSHPNATKQAGAEWHLLTAEQKQPYEQMAAQDKERYTREMANYVPNPPEEAPETPSSAPAPKKQAKQSKPAPAGPAASATPSSSTSASKGSKAPTTQSKVPAKKGTGAATNAKKQ
jgi:hypothetical protein